MDKRTLIEESLSIENLTLVNLQLQIKSSEKQQQNLRIYSEIAESFKACCEENNLSSGDIVSALIELFLRENYYTTLS